MSYRSITVSLLFAALGILPPAYGCVIVNDFGPGDTYNSLTGQAIGGTTNQDVGDRFTVTGASSIRGRVVLPLGLVLGISVVILLRRSGLGRLFPQPTIARKG
jgi:hypothetical protein